MKEDYSKYGYYKTLDGVTIEYPTMATTSAYREVSGCKVFLWAAGECSQCGKKYEITHNPQYLPAICSCVTESALNRAKKVHEDNAKLLKENTNEL